MPAHENQFESRLEALDQLSISAQLNVSDSDNIDYLENGDRFEEVPDFVGSSAV